MLRWSVILIVALAPALLGADGAAAALPAPCGTISSSTTFTGDREAPCIVGESGIVIDLNGFEVRCSIPDPNRPGFDVKDRSGVTIRGLGRIRNCGTGVLVRGGGGHRLGPRLIVTEHHGFAGTYLGVLLHGDGISVRQSSGNAIFGNDISRNDDTGVWLRGSSNNFVVGNVVNDQGKGSGIEATESSNDNLIAGNSLERNSSQGLLVVDSARNRIVANRVSGTDADGISGFNAPGTVIDRNQSVRNDFGGITLFGSTGARITRNTASENKAGPGISLRVGSTAARVEGNTALGNATVDLEDDNIACDANIWTANTFKTRNQPCIH